MSAEEIKDKKLLHEEITEEVIGVFPHVYNTLGYRFPEKVYHKAILISLRKEGWSVEREKKIIVCVLPKWKSAYC